MATLSPFVGDMIRHLGEASHNFSERYSTFVSSLPEEVTRRNILLGIGALMVFRWTVLVIYRFFFHPLARAGIKGPPLASGSYLWLFYWDVIRNGRRTLQMPDLHKKYGTLVRIGPNEVHIHDLDIYHKIYRNNTPFLKDPLFYSSFGITSASFTIINPHEYRARREILNPLFSKRAVHTLEGRIQHKVDYLCDKIKALSDQGRFIPLQKAFYCTTVDIISEYCFGKSFNLLDAPDFISSHIDNVCSLSVGMWPGYHMPWMRPIALALPKFLAAKIAGPFMQLVWSCEALVTNVLETKRTTSEKLSNEHPTIFDAILDPAATKNRVPQYTDLVHEAMVLLMGGTDTTANTLAFATWFFLTVPGVRERILEELVRVPKHGPRGKMMLKDLEACTYLTGFIKETLRNAHGIPGRAPRIVPEGGLTIPSTGQFIPAGTVVGCSPMMFHRDARIFEDPYEFRPERWIGQSGRELEKWLLCFSKGTRQCLGLNLAYAELYLILAHLFVRFDMRPFDTTPTDMEWLDHGISHTKGMLKVTVQPRD
jgi:cytochrome P450